jgi:hypothetical protein
MIKNLQSIEQVEKVFDTGDKPLLIHCTDLEFYVSKYNSTAGTANLLFREFMTASFLKLWALQVPDFAIVTLQPHHNPTNGRYINNAMPCFGSMYNNEYRELDAFINEVSQAQRGRFNNTFDLLKITLFDYWVSNEDRNHNNYNLMLKMEDKSYQFIPIDGGAVFHTGNQNRENHTLSIEESLISSPLFQNLIIAETSFNAEIIANLKEIYYFYIQRCKSQLQNIINDVPEEWQISKPAEAINLDIFLFNPNWIEECWTTFLEHLHNPGI